MNYQTLSVQFSQRICRIRFDRPEANNAMNTQMIAELGQVLAHCAQPDTGTTVVVLEGEQEVFCVGGDFDATAQTDQVADPEPMYDLWLRLATGPFVSISLVRGRANAGGVGFVAASDIVLADTSASFSLSELLFGLFPACVLPFLVRRIGHQKAHYMTLMTSPIDADAAHAWGLIDVLGDSVDVLLRNHLLRLRHLDGAAIARYKQYRQSNTGGLTDCKPAALEANRALFSDTDIRSDIRRYVKTGLFPWESA
ncbi:MAG: enoyl-CoA hydratase/isomerase [Pseudomonadota bacterium]